MRIDLYTRCWNDADMLGFFFRNYDHLVQRYIVYDDGSTDNSLEILRANPKVEIRPMPAYSDPESLILSSLSLRERCWKESRGVADWVIVTDIDEHLHHCDIASYLKSCKDRGVTIIPALGYQMLSEEFPQGDLWLSQSLTMGEPNIYCSKLNIFSPNEIDATNCGIGRHNAAPAGNVVAPMRDELLLLHYHLIGFERTQRRHEQAKSRLGKKDVAMGWAAHYSWSKEQHLEEWKNTASRLVDISQPNLRPWETHKEPRWWEGYRRAM